MRLSSRNLLAAVAWLAVGNAAGASGPPPPQQQQAESGTEAQRTISLEVDPGGSLFVDPLWTGGGQGTCRYVLNPSPTEWFIQIGSPTEWQSFETASDQQFSENYATQQVCCRPGAPSDSFCSGGTVDSVSDVGGAGTLGYGQAGTPGTATAQCHDANGTYTETHAYNCGMAGSGVNADGIWQFTADQGDSCTSAATTTYGACSTAGVGGWGYELATVKDCFGTVVSSNYSGPSCYITPPCTPDYEFDHCNTSTAVLVDQNGCGGPNHAQANGCALVKNTVGGGSCTYEVPNYSPGGYSGPTSDTYYEFYDCGGGAASTWDYWGTTSGSGVSCTSSKGSEPYDYYLNGVYQFTKYAASVDAISCTASEWQQQ